MSEEVIEQWLNEMSKSVAMRNLDKHMGLVSKHVQVYGIPGQDVINYKQWRLRRRNEFDKKLLRSLTYRLVQVKTMGLRRLAFQAEETMRASSGQAIWLLKDIILEQEEDQQWRVVEEKIRQWHLKDI